MTQREEIEGVLEAVGCRRITCRLSKYHVWSDPTRVGRYFFVGRNGALRAGKNATASISLTDTVPAFLAAARLAKKEI